jgi:heme exporter protein CcmB|tara:strand:- start:836 stop:1486 length:651 start_codon:yes stop_codon:yes gene_type:complete
MLNNLIIKELKLEFRTKETILSMFLLGIILTFLFSITIENVKQEFIIVYFWIIIFMISSLGLYRSYQNEKNLDSFNMMLSSPVDPSIIFISKVISFFIQILIVQIFLFPIFILFFKLNFNFSYAVLFLTFATNWYISSLGNIIGGITLRSNRNEMIIPILLFPFSAPILLAIIRATEGIVNNYSFYDFSNWIFIIITSSIVVFILGIWAYYDIIKE